MKINVRLIYLYLFSFVGLLTVVIGSVRLVDLGLKVFVFPDADRYEFTSPKIPGEPSPVNEEEMKMQAARDQTRNRQRDLSNSIAMIAVGLPLYLYHWKTIQKENKSKK
jgi:hypothetical protein